jgi:hypothetical protein
MTSSMRIAWCRSNSMPAEYRSSSTRRQRGSLHTEIRIRIAPWVRNIRPKLYRRLRLNSCKWDSLSLRRKLNSCRQSIRSKAMTLQNSNNFWRRGISFKLKGISLFSSSHDFLKLITCNTIQIQVKDPLEASSIHLRQSLAPRKTLFQASNLKYEAITIDSDDSFVIETDSDWFSISF